MFRKKTSLPKQTSSEDEDEFGIPAEWKSSSPSPKKKKAATTRKTKTPTKQTTPTKTTPKQSMYKSFLKSRTTFPKPTVDESYKRKIDEKLNEAQLPTIFEQDINREQANALLDSISNQGYLTQTVSRLNSRPENVRKMIRFATDNRKKFKTLTPIQQQFLDQLNDKIKTENSYTRMIHEETRDVADRKINWTSSKSKLPRGVIVLAHTHGGFVNSNDLIKYPTDVNDTLESVSTYYLSDIGALACNIREDYKKYDENFLLSLLRERRSLKNGFSIKDISEKAQEGLKHVRLKNIDFDFDRNTGLLQNYFEAGVYNLAVCTKTNNIPFLNKRYSCGKRGGELGGYKLQSIQVFQEDRLKPLSEIIGRKPEFDCQNEHSSITTFELVQELTKVIPDLEHVLVIDTSCSPFTPSIVKEIFKEIPNDSTPHKHRETGLFKEMSPSPEKNRWDDVFGSEKKTKQELQKQERKQKLKTIKVNLKKYFDEGLKGGKKTKKRHHRYNKNKSIKNKNKRSRKYTKTYYMRGGATSEQIAAAVVMRPLILNLTGSKNSKEYKDLNRIIHHEG
jgi:hypothetical protein